jgi:hypothetical protein
MVEINGQWVPFDDYLNSLSVDEVRGRLAAVQVTVSDLKKQLRQDDLMDYDRGPKWRRSTEAALRAGRVEAAYISWHLRKVEAEWRFAKHYSQVPDAHLIALERTHKIIEAMIERDRLEREKQKTKQSFFVEAVRELLSPEQFAAVWRAAEQIDPDNECWKPWPPMTSGEQDAMKRARKLRLRAARGELTGAEEDAAE